MIVVVVVTVVVVTVVVVVVVDVDSHLNIFSHITAMSVSHVRSFQVPCLTI